MWPGSITKVWTQVFFVENTVGLEGRERKNLLGDIVCDKYGKILYTPQSLCCVTEEKGLREPSKSQGWGLRPVPPDWRPSVFSLQHILLFLVGPGYSKPGLLMKCPSRYWDRLLRLHSLGPGRSWLSDLASSLILIYLLSFYIRHNCPIAFISWISFDFTETHNV